MALPFVRSLRLNAPDAEITLLTRPGLVELYAQAQDADRVLALDETAGRRGLRSVWRNARRLRPQHFDIGFCLPPSFGSALMFRMAGIKRRVGHAADRRGWLLTDSLPYLPNGKRPHRADGYLELLSCVWGHAQTDRRLRYDPGESARADADRLLGNFPGRSVLAVAPGAAQPNKLWPASRFAEVCRRWLETAEASVILTGGSSDRSVADVVMRGIDSSRVLNLCGAGSLALTGAIIERTHLFLGNDSGLSHLAAAVGVPVVVISGPGDPGEVSPLTENAITVKKPLFCSPCYSNTCFRSDHPLECQDLVGVDDVWQAIVKTGQMSKKTQV